MTKRAQYIKDSFRLYQTDNGYRAVSLYKGREFSFVEGPVRAEVIREARRQWGHFNYGDEAEAFAEVFPPQ